MSASNASAPDAARSGRSVIVHGLAAAIAATVVNLVIALVAPAAGASMKAGFGGALNTIGLPIVVPATLVTLAIAAVVTWLIVRRRPAARRLLAWLGLVVALASVAAPIIGAADAATAVSLASMHVVAGVCWLVGLLTAR